MKLRPANPDEKAQVIEWGEKNKARNAFDPKVLDYPLTRTVAAFNGKTVAFIPLHPVLIMDSVAPNPEADGRDLHDALESFLECAEGYARLSGMGEVMFLASDERVARATLKRGFKESGMKVYRKAVR